MRNTLPNLSRIKPSPSLFVNSFSCVKRFYEDAQTITKKSHVKIKDTKVGISLRCLNTVCARSTICTADVNKCLYSDHFILFSEDCASVFSVLTIKQFVMCQKRLFFNVLKVMLLQNTLPFWDCLYGSRKIENPVMQRMRS